MKQISKLLFYDEILDLTIPKNIKNLGNPWFDYPFFIKDNFLNSDEIDTIFGDIKDENSKIASIKQIKDNYIDTKIDTNYRKTDTFSISNLSKSLYLNRFANVKLEIEQFFRFSMIESDNLQLLGYKKGYFYSMHSDNANYILNKNGDIEHWRVVASERKVTTVLFLTTEVENSPKAREHIGGSLVFNFLFDEDKKLATIKPKAGLLIAFPSNPYFAHSVEKVIEGYRASVVSWHNGVFN